MHLKNRLTILLGTARASTPWTEALAALTDGRRVQVDETARSWPFRRSVLPADGADKPETVVIQSLHDAFPAGQRGPARLVLTQSTYQLQRWLDWLEANQASSMIGALTAPSPDVVRDASSRRGPWARAAIVEVAPGLGAPPDRGDHASLHGAFRQADPDLRYVASLRAATDAPADPAICLALASACMETSRLDEAEETLEHALAHASDWEAVHYELGKLWLRRDDTGRAAACFAEAAQLMPSFAAAHANLGAALGELERPEEALVALERAALLDPFGHPIHNNIGASLRDLGRLTEAEASFRRVIALDSAFVFGYYNMGHVLFLQGRFEEARQAYDEGLARDLLRTPRQRLRLALTLAALDDEGAAQEHARSALDDAPEEARGDLLDEMEEVLEALTALQGERRRAVQTLERLVGDYRSTIPRS